MSIYTFQNQYSFTDTSPGPRSSTPGAVETNPSPRFDLPGISQLSDIDGRTSLTWEKDTVSVEDIQEFTSPGFHYLDEALLLYWGDIRIPIGDIAKFMQVKISGRNKSLDVWVEELKHGRVKLPIMSISRGDHKFHTDKFSPAYHPMAMRYNGRRTRITKTFRPVPYLVSYTMTIWAETKWDAEHALHQILTRFNPLAQLRVSDGHCVGEIVMDCGGAADATDKDVAPEESGKVKYEIAFTAEAWLSLPEQVLPTVLSFAGGFKMGSETYPFERLRIGAPNVR